jgi:RHS repeat-associated protein
MAGGTATIFESPHFASFTYGPDNERKKMTMTGGDEPVTRYYHGNYEEVEIGNDIYRIHYIGGGDGLAAIRVQHLPSSGNTEGGETKLYYVYKDHLGSILTLTDEEGDVEHEQSFDAWGRYRDPHTWQVLNSDPSDDELEVDMPVWFSRGYTGHEHLREFDLINMNGRMYDPAIGRMLAPDNFVQDPYNTQSYNRYAYVFNSPLSYTDPSGEIAGWIVSLIATAGSYLMNAGINQSWNPNEWTSGMVGFGVGYGGGGGYLIGGGNIGGNYSVMAGGSFNGGSYQYGYQAGPGLASTSMVQPAGTVNINMNLVDNYRGYSANYYDFGSSDYRELIEQGPEIVSSERGFFPQDAESTNNGNYADLVEALIGMPYVWGQAGPHGFDCSGTVCFGIRQLAPEFIRTTADGLYRNYTVSSSSRGRGTLIFYDYKSDGKIDHVTTILNDTQMLHPSQSKGILELRPIDYLNNYTNKQGGSIYYREINWSIILKDGS